MNSARLFDHYMATSKTLIKIKGDLMTQSNAKLLKKAKDFINIKMHNIDFVTEVKINKLVLKLLTN